MPGRFSGLSNDGFSHVTSMPRNVYSEINLRITWHTKQRAAVIVDGIEQQLHQYLQQRVRQTPHVICRALGGTTDHLHLAVTVPPTLLVSDWVGQLKGASAHYVNHHIANRKILEWQSGYGIVSFGTGDLSWVVSYVRNQKQHHGQGTTQQRLEQTDTLESSLKRAARGTGDGRPYQP